MRVDLEIDDGVVQFAGQLAHFLVEATVPGLAELLDQLHRLLEVPPFETVHQFARMFFRVDSNSSPVESLPSTMTPSWPASAVDPLENLSIFSFRT